MPEPFARDDELDVEVPLIRAYEFLDEPKPTLDRILRLLKAGELSGRRSEAGVWFVPSIAVFVSEVGDWIRRNNWSHGSIWNAIPVGYVGIAAFCRDNVALTIGAAQRLFASQKPGEKSQLTPYARELIAAGDCEGAMQVHHGVWAAKPGDVKQWLYRRFGIRV